MNKIAITRNHIQGVSSLAALGLVLADQPLWALVPIALHTAVFLPKGFRALKSLTPRNKFLATLTTALGIEALHAASALAQIEFSFILERTEEMANTCIFNQITGLLVISFIFFGAIRLMVMAGLVSVAFAAWQEKRKQQEYSEQVQTIVYGVLAIIVVGVIEPLIVNACG